ncbi:hypothetical protein NDU88_005947 [Pleurodeles waltl]|uniref:Uncharacterized protein n=1 Tax=Pleurodeles waltl TaxID=8319 RepID=A0AAV7LR02_PLEWA|nr:hypothetical protein NDU88_005947 [Pleurodeles waltl]
MTGCSILTTLFLKQDIQKRVSRGAHISCDARPLFGPGGQLQIGSDSEVITDNLDNGGGLEICADCKGLRPEPRPEAPVLDD